MIVIEFLFIHYHEIFYKTRALARDKMLVGKKE